MLIMGLETDDYILMIFWIPEVLDLNFDFTKIIG